MVLFAPEMALWMADGENWFVSMSVSFIARLMSET